MSNHAATTKSKKDKARNYFFFNGDLHKRLHINRGADLLSAWNFPKGKMVKYSYSQIKREGERAWTTRQVTEMLNRKWDSIFNAVNRGDVERPQHSYNLESKHKAGYYWSEKDIMNLHSYFTSIHFGRPRNDGRVTPAKSLPTAAELRAMIRQGTVLYIKTESGEFVPTWKAENF